MTPSKCFRFVSKPRTNNHILIHSKYSVDEAEEVQNSPPPDAVICQGQPGCLTGHCPQTKDLLIDRVSEEMALSQTRVTSSS